MKNNLFVSYDLDAPGQNYAKAIRAIESLGQAIKVHRSLFYVKSNYGPEEAEKIVWAALDSNDRLIVIDAKEAFWHEAMGSASAFIQQHWYS